MAVQLKPAAGTGREQRVISAPIASLTAGMTAVGYQLFDPATGRFILEGEWIPAEGLKAGDQVSIALPAVRGPYHVYVSAVGPEGWAYAKGELFTLITCEVTRDLELQTHGVESVRLRALQRRRAAAKFRGLLAAPWHTISENWPLVRSMVKRDMHARYRGSFADRFWAVLNPLLLMLTYWFVFGLVLRTRFGPSNSSSGFVLYFLAGMLPWLAFSEALGRAPHVILENRVYVKKLVFPVDILPFNLVVSGLVTEVIGLAIFLVFLIVLQGIPATIAWLPVLLIPQLLLTAGFVWGLAAVSVRIRDVAQVMGFLLTLWFFITPICYPETALPAYTLPVLGKNPIYTLVRGYRAILLEGAAPEWHSLWKLWLLSVIVFFGGYGIFSKLRPTFADVI